MSAFTDALAQGLAAIRTAAGDEVSYQRGGTTLEGVVAVVGSTRFEADDKGEVVVDRYQLRDFLISVADLAEDFGQPRKGDRIIAGEAVYEVNPPTGGKVFGYSDPDNTTYRIHTKRVT